MSYLADTAGPWIHSIGKDDTMSHQNKNAQPSPFETGPKNVGGIDDIEESEDRVEGDEQIEQGDGRRAGGGRPSEIEKPNSADNRRGSEP